MTFIWQYLTGRHKIATAIVNTYPVVIDAALEDYPQT
jgi:hypothetical protein